MCIIKTWPNIFWLKNVGCWTLTTSGYRVVVDGVGCCGGRWSWLRGGVTCGRRSCCRHGMRSGGATSSVTNPGVCGPLKRLARPTPPTMARGCHSCVTTAVTGLSRTVRCEGLTPRLSAGKTATRTRHANTGTRIQVLRERSIEVRNNGRLPPR